MSYCCQQDDRRDLVRRMNGRNGLDYVEVSGDQLTLFAYFLGKLPPELVKPDPGGSPYLRIEGGRRVTGIRIVKSTPVVDPDPEKDDYLTLQVDKPGDFSRYTLRLSGVENIDPRYASAEFSFKVDCPSDLDCAPSCDCLPAAPDEPEINYLAKDYQSFRQLILDRLAVVMPDWKERHAADIEIALVEVLAYTADYLSYYQDAVATEAYLNTARRRISVRRHARLVDYQLSEGCNARAWVCIQIDGDAPLDPLNAFFITGLNDALAAKQSVLQTFDLDDVPVQDYEVFEPCATASIPMRAAHSEIHFYTWGESECCLRRGSTSATLLDPGGRLRLAPGDVLIFEEVIGPKTGLPADADPARRHAVRLTKVAASAQDPVTGSAAKPTAFVDIEWHKADALPFTFCVSTLGPAPDCRYIPNVSVARGNVILVDHGRTLPPEQFGPVPVSSTGSVCECVEQPGDVAAIPGRLPVQLRKTPVTFRQALPHSAVPAARMFVQDVRQALPQVWLTSDPPKPWESRYDLIGSTAGDWRFVVEIDNDGLANLRFGDGDCGAQPPAGMTLQIGYRVGNGAAGNVGAESISRLVLRNQKIGGAITVRNPLPARGGIDAESIAEAKLFAPYQFRKILERAVVASDYEQIAGRNTNIQRAAASLSWTGSWYEADVAVDPVGSETPAAALLSNIEEYLEQFRRVGQDLEVLPAIYVPLDLQLEVCALPSYERAQVKRALLEAFSNRKLTGGRLGFFHPDNLTFGEGVYLSRIIAGAQAVTGVECVRVTRFKRLFAPSNHEIDNGVLPLGAFEIAQLDNDPNFPEHGKLDILVSGGR